MTFALVAALARAGSAMAQAPTGTAASYVDRVLETGPQVDEPITQDGQDNAGLTRSVRVDYSLSQQNLGGISERVQGLSLSGFIDTPNHGALSLNANGSTRTDGGIAAARAPLYWRFDQRAFPLEGGWLAQHSAGYINTPLVPLAQGIGRVFVPANTLAGIAGSWTHGSTFSFNMAGGRSGHFSSGIDANGFELHPGSVASAGLQWSRAAGSTPSGRLEAAMQTLHATDVPALYAGRQTGTAGTWGSVAWQGVAPWASEVRGSERTPMGERAGGMRVQGQWLRSQDARVSQGAWVDAAWRTEWLQNTAGVYRFDPGLRWGSLFLPGDLQGAYWRADVLTQRWQLGWNVEADTGVAGRGRGESYASIYGRYRLNTASALSGGASVRTGAAAGGQLDAGWDFQSDLGQSLLRTRLVRTSRRDVSLFGIDQAWPLEAPWALSTSIQSEQQRGADGSGRRLIWGILSSYTGFETQRLDASLRGARGDHAQSLSLNMAATWQIRREWSLSARAYVARGAEPQLATISSALTDATTAAPLAATPVIRGVQFMLRYEWRGGNTLAPLGGAPGSGAGALTGTVFLDRNENGRRDAASEPGVPNIAIVLDGRFVAHTDSQGRYEFPAVVSGPHHLQIEADNVPLPWSPPTRERVEVDVPVRGTATFDFPLQRDHISAQD